MKNVGKIFEEDFIKSVPTNIFNFRFRDLPHFLTKNNKYMINNNPCDFLIYNRYLYTLELKSCAGASYPISNTRENQVEGLLKFSKMLGVISGFIINMRKYNETYFLHIDDYIHLTKIKKSINIKELRIYGIRINQELKRTRYKYNLEDLFKINVDKDK